MPPEILAKDKYLKKQMKIVFQQKKKKLELANFIEAKQADGDPTDLRNSLAEVEKAIRGLEQNIKDQVEQNEILKTKAKKVSKQT